MNMILKKTYFSLHLFLLCSVMFSAAIHAQDVTIKLTADRNPVGLTDPFSVKLEISGSSQNLPEPQLPVWEDFRVLAGPSTSTNYRIINGSMSASKSYSFTLLAKKIGTYTIPAVSVMHQGKKISSNPLTLTVQEQVNSPQASGNNSGNARSQSQANSVFLRAIPSKRNAYVNEQLTLSYRLYFRAPVRSPEFLKLPETVGFWVEEFDIPKDVPVSQETIDGVQYNVAELKRMAIFPTKAGELSISPMQLQVNVINRRKRRDPFDVFDNFFDGSFGKAVRKVLTTRSIKINVKPLPNDGKPDSFTGLVGSFSLTSELDKSETEANEAISLKLRLSGSGNLKSADDLAIQFPGGFEVYDPKVKESVNRSGRRLSSAKELEYVLIPRSAGVYEIKPLEVSFFDPAQRRYKTLRTPPYEINVARGKNADGSVAAYVPKSEVRLLGKDIHFIKEGALELVPINHRPYTSGWFFIALLLPIIGLAAAFGYRRHQDKMTTNVGYARGKRALKQASQRLKGARTLLDEQKYEAFYAEASSGVVGFVADKCNVSAAGLLRDDVDTLLRKQQVNDELVRECLNYLDEADFKRFAPGSDNAEGAEAFYNRAEVLLEKLGKHFQ